MALNTGHEISYDLTARVAEALSIAAVNAGITGTTVFPHYGETIEEQEVAEIGWTDSEEIRAYVIIPRYSDEGLHKTTHGVYSEGSLDLLIFSQNAYSAIKGMTLLFKSFGYTTPTGSLGSPTQAFDIGNLRVLKFDPVGGFNFTARPYGGRYLNEHLINFKIRVSN